MQRSLLEILACPADKHHPLRLVEFESQGETVVEGVMLCDECGRYFPISGEIANMLPDELRSKKEDLEFLKKWKGRMPAEVASRGKPWNLGQP